MRRTAALVVAVALLAGCGATSERTRPAPVRTMNTWLDVTDATHPLRRLGPPSHDRYPVATYDNQGLLCMGYTGLTPAETPDPVRDFALDCDQDRLLDDVSYPSQLRTQSGMDDTAAILLGGWITLPGAAKLLISFVDDTTATVDVVPVDSPSQPGISAYAVWWGEGRVIRSDNRVYTQITVLDRDGRTIGRLNH